MIKEINRSSFNLESFSDRRNLIIYVLNSFGFNKFAYSSVILESLKNIEIFNSKNKMPSIHLKQSISIF